MTYLLLDLAFLVPVTLVAVAAMLARRAPRWRAVALAAVVLLVMTVVFDNVIVGLGIVAYDPARILGIRMPIAPVEDLSYTIAAVVLLPALWSLLGAPGVAAARGEPSALVEPGRDRGAPVSKPSDEHGRRT